MDSTRDTAITALPMDDEGNVYAKSSRPSATDLASLVAVAEPAEAGDVLVIDVERPGLMRLATTAADTGVFGIVAAEPGMVLGAGADDLAVDEETTEEFREAEARPTVVAVWRGVLQGGRGLRGNPGR